MSVEAVQMIVGTAVIDRRFRQTLLEKPAAAIKPFELAPDEYAVVLAIEANTLEQFARKIDEWITAKAAERRDNQQDNLTIVWQTERLALR